MGAALAALVPGLGLLGLGNIGPPVSALYGLWVGEFAYEKSTLGHVFFSF